MARKLRERLGMVTTAQEPEPALKVPAADKAGALVEAAESGFAAIQALYADRNKSVELAQSLHQHNVYLSNINTALKQHVAQLKLERDMLLKSNARLGAWVQQMHDLFRRFSSEVQHTSVLIDQQPPPPEAPDEPVAPPVDAKGLPVVGEPEVSFDAVGLPEGAVEPVQASIVHNDTIRELLTRLRSQDEPVAAS